MQIDAMTVVLLDSTSQKARRYLLLMGANHRMMRCSQFVGKEQIVPNRQRTKIARRTV
jgi:hypothetical protein